MRMVLMEDFRRLNVEVLSMHLLCTAAFPVHDQDTVAAPATNLLVVYLVSICKACMRPRVPLMIEKRMFIGCHRAFLISVRWTTLYVELTKDLYVGKTSKDKAADSDGSAVAIVPEFSKAEIDLTVDRFRWRNRAPVSDGIPSRIWGEIHAARPVLLLVVFNSWLRSGSFPGRLKIVRLALLPKPDKPQGLLSSYQLLCLLNDFKKDLKFLLVRRIEEHMTTTVNEQSEWQFNFSLRSSVNHVIRLVHEKMVTDRNARRMSQSRSRWSRIEIVGFY